MDIKEVLLDGDADGELHGDQLLVAQRVAAARPGGAIRLGEEIERIIARDNHERPVSPPAQMSTPPTPQRVGPSGLNAHMPPFRRRVDSSDEEEPERPVWPPRRSHMEFETGDYEQDEEVEPEPARRWKRVRRCANPFLDAEAGLDGDASDDEAPDNKIDDLNGFIMPRMYSINYL